MAQTATQTRWQTRGERFGEISLVLIGFTIPLSTAPLSRQIRIITLINIK